MRETLRRLAVLAVLCSLATPVLAAPIVVVNGDGPGVGFNDPAPRAPEGGNTATTLGAQRLQAFQFAADIWGQQLVSAVTITVDATMPALPCNSTTATLGQAGPNTLINNFPGALFTNTWYPQALANKLAGSDLDGADDDIVAQFSSSIGTTCPFPQVWYYGLDGAAPAGTLDFVSVVTHELGHGLGFLTFVDETTGAKFKGLDDPFEQNLEDGGVFWPTMTDAQRKASAIDTGNLRWAGPAVVAASGILTSGKDASGHVLMFAPNPDQPGSSVSHWDTSCFPNQLMEPVYTGPIHDPGLAREAFTDIGWGSETPGPTTSTVTTTSTTTTLPASCPDTPLPGCQDANASQLRLVQRAVAAKNRLGWTWSGSNTTLADFQDPRAGTSVMHLCVYDASARTEPILDLSIPSGGTCGKGPCWKTIGKTANPAGYRYHDPSGKSDGVVVARLKGQASGGTLAITGRGANLPAPALALTLPVDVQFFTAGPGGLVCWQGSYATAKRNDTGQFKAKSP